MKLNKKIGNYVLESEIGRGNFSVVYLAKKQNAKFKKK